MDNPKKTEDGDAVSRRRMLDEIVRRGQAEKPGLAPYLDALSQARREGWYRLEVEEYLRLGGLLHGHKDPLDAEVARRLCEELTQTGIKRDIWFFWRFIG